MVSSGCLLCASTEGEVILEVDRLPALANALWPTAEAARAASSGEVRLGFCAGCGAVRNLAFDASLVAYGPDYENSLHFSPRFREYAAGLAERLVSTYGLQGRSVLEIGSGKGDFLSLLCQAGAARGIGYDPSYGGEVEGATTGERLTFVRELYPREPGAVEAALVCCRHVLEHVERPADLLAGLRRALEGNDDVAVYFEVPDGGYMLANLGVWDVVYEHPWYFSAPSLRRLFTAAGFSITTEASSFGGQYLFVEARPSPVREPAALPADELEGLRRHATGFGARFRAVVERWGSVLAEADEAGRRVAVWGIGSKGVTFLNVVPGADRLDCVVDVNPRKRGRHVPGTGQQVVGPGDLRAPGPDLVLVMNPLYLDEIRASTAEMGLVAEVVAVGSD